MDHLLNGTLDLNSNEKGKPVLTATRIAAKRYGFPMPLLTSYSDAIPKYGYRVKSFSKRSTH
jgi:hypothetical protein